MSGESVLGWLRIFLPLTLIWIISSTTGEVVHITVLTVGYTSVGSSSGEYQCYPSAPDTDATLSFGRSAPITTVRSPLADVPHSNTYPLVRRVIFPTGDGWDVDGFGPFYCEASKYDRDVTRVTTFFQRSDAKFISSDGLFTKTVNVNDTGVMISMTNNPDAPSDNLITWKKDGSEVLPSFGGQTQISFPNPIQTSDQGIYEIYYNNERDQNKGGLYRLIVRECPADNWGPPECYGICDKCYNGGVCDDKSGLCICPNNFKGPNCLEICRPDGGNRFGLNCEFQCSYMSTALVTECHGYLFCLPDPYGCSCDVGAHGLTCTTLCTPTSNTYGPGCSQTCHCAGGSSCNIFSGICTDSTGGCQIGWSGVNCQIPDECEAGYYGSQCTDKCHCLNDEPCDKGTGECPEQKCALGYKVRSGQVQCQECEGDTFGLDCVQQCHCAQEACETERGLCQGQCIDGWFEPSCRQRISRLVPERVNPYQPSIFTCYVEGIPLPDASSVDLYRRTEDTNNRTGITRRSSTVSGSERAVVFDVDSVYPQKDGGYVCILTVEGVDYPSTPITNATYDLPVIEKAPLIVSTTSTTVGLQWNAWSEEDDIGDPPLVGYDVFVEKDGDWVTDQRANQPTTSAIVSNLTPDTGYRFRVAAVREGTGGTGPESPRSDAITLCRKPSASPTGLQVSAINPKELEVIWEHLPSELAECRSGVTHYMIYYAGSTSLNSLMVPNDTSSYTLRGLDTYLDYTIQLTASNKDEESERSSETIGKTLEEVAPSPINVAIPRSTTSSFTVSWSTPLPSNTNGNIQKYIIRYQQTDPVVDGDYKSEDVLNDAFEGEHTVVDLTATTNYSVQVQTVNGAGSSNWSEPVNAKTIQSGLVPPSSGVVVPVGNSVAPVAGGAVGAILIILIIIVVVIIVFKRRRNDSNPSKKENIEDQSQAPVDFQDTPLEENNYSGHASVSNPDQTRLRSTRPKPHVAVKPSVRQTKSLDLDSTDGSPDRSSNKPLATRQPIPLAQFPAFVNKNRHTVLFSEEFHDLPGPDIYPQTVAREEINFTKNRYKNILPYDSARVKLEVINNDPHSDYFNASYIPSFDNDKAYIASQGPNKASMDDFWRMVWQENVTTIAMVTKLKEGDKIKCGKYWPNVPGDSVKFGHIKVELVSLEACTGGIKRKMTMIKDEELRTVTQFHFTEWPDKGVPKHTSSLLKFIKEVKANHGQNTHPLVIHCSAGVGRSGVVISIDSVVAHAKTTRMVDVFNFVTNIRQKRPYMVQTQEQYAFIYGAVLEDLLWRNTLIPLIHFTDHLQDLHTSVDESGRSKMTKEFETLKSLCPDPPPSRTRSGRTPDNQPKNRYGNNLPLQRNRVILDSPDEDYINASQMKGGHCTFLTTQMPLPTTVSDFWSMVLDFKPSTIIMLNDKSQNDKSCAQYWPDDDSAKFGSYSVATLSTSTDGDMTTRQMKVTRNSEASHTVTHYQFLGWPKHGSNQQLGARSLIKLIRAVKGSTNNKREFSVLVHCLSGAGRTGVFCTAMECIAQIAEGDSVDIFQTVKILRADRMQFVQTEEEYAFVYDVIREYLHTENYEQLPYPKEEDHTYGNVEIDYTHDPEENPYEVTDSQDAGAAALVYDNVETERSQDREKPKPQQQCSVYENFEFES